MIVIRRQHDLGLAKAKRLAQKMARTLKDRFGGTYTWNGDELHFERPGASGSVKVTKDSVDVRVDLGLLLRPLRARIAREIREGLDTHLGDDKGATSAARSR